MELLDQIRKLTNDDDWNPGSNTLIQQMLNLQSLQEEYHKIKDLLTKERSYIKCYQRRLLIIFLKTARSTSDGSAGPFNSSIQILSFGPRGYPILGEEIKNIIVYLLTKYFEPLLSKNPIAGDAIIDDWGEYDIPEELRALPFCSWCNSKANFICPCSTASYCSLLCKGLDWWNHKKICRSKSD